MVCEVEREKLKAVRVCVYGRKKKYVKCVYFYGSRQMYFCGENISIEMQKELAYTPPLSKREKKNLCVLKS